MVLGWARNGPPSIFLRGKLKKKFWEIFVFIVNIIYYEKEHLFIPKTIGDAAMYAVPWTKATRAIGGIGKKGAKYVNKVYRNMGK